MFRYIEKIRKHDRIISACLAIVYLYSAISPIRPFGTWPGLLLGGILVAFFCFSRKKIIGILPLPAAADIKVILLVGFVIRLLWVIFSGNTWVSDFANYNERSISMLEGIYLPHIEMPPGTSLITAFFYWIFGINRYVALLPVIFASVAIIYIVYLLAQKIFGETTAKVSAILYSLCPEQILYTNLVNSEIYFAFFVLAAFWSLLASPSRRLVFNVVLAGALLGMSQCVRPNSILFLFCAALFLVLYSKKRSLANGLRLNVVLIASYLAVLIPLMVFNYSNFQELTINSSRYFGWSFFLSTNPVYNGKYNDEDFHLWKERVKVSTRLPNEDESAFKSRVATEMAKERLLTSPFRFITNCFKKPYLFLNDPASFKWSLNGIKSVLLINIIFAIGLVYHRILLVLSGLSYCFMVRNSPNEKIRGFLFLTSSTILLVTLSHFFLEIQTRYHYMLMPYVIIGAASYFTKITGGSARPVTNNEVPITHDL